MPWRRDQIGQEQGEYPVNTELVFCIAFWVLFGGMLVMQVCFASRLRQAGERVKADREAIEREG